MKKNEKYPISNIQYPILQSLFSEHFLVRELISIENNDDDGIPFAKVIDQRDELISDGMDNTLFNVGKEIDI